MHLHPKPPTHLIDVLRHLVVVFLSQQDRGGQIGRVAHIQGSGILIQNDGGTRGQVNRASHAFVLVHLLPTALSFGRSERDAVGVDGEARHEEAHKGEGIPLL